MSLEASLAKISIDYEMTINLGDTQIGGSADGKPSRLEQGE